ncbi:tetratricopeptide repeat protein [Arenimonas sp. MALMAid1274]|uniref:tetratricopeptide repeat protein n=1 Tax=Arenimonas sp. MALMAid1274 TaxID=3411630 RepID=UPI003B9F4F1E
MSILGIGLHVIAAIFFAVHAIRTQQPLYWLFILFMFPLLGSLVYGIAIFLPELRQSRGMRKAGRKVQQLLDPGRELRAALEAHDHAPSVGNQLRVADALLEAGRPAEAVVHYEQALKGLYAGDPDIRARLARALLESGKPAQAREQLDGLIADKPDFRSAPAHLVYARAVAELGDRERAHEEFGVLVGYFPGMEARARYAALLREWGDTEAAQKLAAESLRIAQRLPAHSRTQDREWIAMLQKVDRSA